MATTNMAAEDTTISNFSTNTAKANTDLICGVFDSVFSTTCEIDNIGNLYFPLTRFVGKRMTAHNSQLSNYNVNSLKDKNITVKINLNLPFGTEITIDYDRVVYKFYRARHGKPIGTCHNADYYETITIKASSNEAIKKLLEAVAIEHEQHEIIAERDYINIYLWDNGYWSMLSSQKKRKLETIYLDKQNKIKISDDIKHFVASEEIYERFGIPYKKTYLLTGPPGTGKSSLYYALASENNMNVGIFKLDTDRASLETAIKKLPKNTILGIEDIQYVFPTQSREARHKVDISDILNALDGVFVKRGLITILTSNSIAEIPKSLLRPGRVDYVLNFAYCSELQIKEIFAAFCPTEDANEFYKKVKNIKLTPAILQRFLFPGVINPSSGLARNFDELREISNSSIDQETHLGLVM